jgi:DNA-binding NtrC family response regulator
MFAKGTHAIDLVARTGIRVTDDSTEPSSPSASPVPQSPEVQVLIFESDSLVARTLDRLVQYAGGRVTLARSVSECRGLGLRLDVGVYDVDMPDALELAREALAAGTVHQAIFYSGSSDVTGHDEAERLGLFISRKAGFAQLIDRVKEVAEHKAQGRWPSIAPPSGVFRKD